MKKLEEIRSRKAISAYGGSGSIIETLNNGSLLVEPYDYWNCYRGNNLFNQEDVLNPRLLAAVQTSRPEYQNIERLVKIPTPDLEEQIYTARRGDLDNTIRSKYFPGWFFCPRCRRLHRLEEWRRLWTLDNRFDDNYPSCYSCSSRVRGRGISRQKLEQVRFVLASLDEGKLIDIPFDRLWNLPNDGKVWNLDNEAPVTDELYYKSTKGGDGLQSINIYRGSGKGAPHKNMGVIYNKYIVFNRGTDKGAYRILLRNGSDVYFPNILSCIYIPRPSEQAKNRVLRKFQRGETAQEIYDDQEDPRTALSIRQIEEIINQSIPDINTPDFRMEEFLYVTNPAIYNNNHQRKERDFWAIRYPNLKIGRIKKFYALRELKETSVLLSYTRVSTESKKWWSIEEDREVNDLNPKQKLPFNPRFQPTFMPASESYGEGLLFEIDSTGITDMADLLTFTHTFCHLLMKEMEFLCGYPVTSLKEHIYHDGEIIGFLIYTIQGAEGSYGGLLSLMPNDINSDGTNGDAKILKLIESANERALDCPNDPICSNDKGHCFACVDLPETSCEQWNNNLDRGIFIKYVDNPEDNNSRIILDD